MEAGRQRNQETKMRGTINDKQKVTDIYLPRKCDFTDRVITSKDYSSVQLSICDVKADGTIDLSKPNLITLCGYVRGTGQSDSALDKVLKEKKLIWTYHEIILLIHSYQYRHTQVKKVCCNNACVVIYRIIICNESWWPSRRRQRSTSTQDRSRRYLALYEGESAVGKSNIISRYAYDKFYIGMNTTIGLEFVSKPVHIAGEEICLQIWDTAGQ